MWGWILAKVVFMTLIPKAECPWVHQVIHEKYTVHSPYIHDRPIHKMYMRQKIKRIHKCKSHIKLIRYAME
jgi:hypothetical protein